MKQSGILLFFFFLAGSCLAQDNAKKIAVIDFFLPDKAEAEALQQKQDRAVISIGVLDYQSTYSEVRKLQSYSVEALLDYAWIKVVERSYLGLVGEERELQKAEEFIDGYVVEQGQSIGADYILLGEFTYDGYLLTLTLLATADGETVAKENIKLKKSLFSNIFSTRKEVGKGIGALTKKIWRK